MTPLLLQLGVVALVPIVALALWLTLRARRKLTDPLIRATLKELQEDWYQISVNVRNRGPHSLTAVSLRRLRPRGARLLPPIMSVSTGEGRYQVWSDRTKDSPRTTIPFDMIVESGEATGDSESQATAWLLLPKKSNAARLKLELTLLDGHDKPHRYQFAISRD
jgi:hypothetical protein